MNYDILLLLPIAAVPVVLTIGLIRDSLKPNILFRDVNDIDAE